MTDWESTLWNDAVADNAVERIEQLIADGTDINEKDKYGWSALHIAAHEDYLDLAKYLSYCYKVFR